MGSTPNNSASRSFLADDNNLDNRCMQVFNDISVLSWNVRGLVNKFSQRQLKDLLFLHRPTFCFVMEPQCLFERHAVWLHYSGYDRVAIAEATGRSGGIWLLQRRGHSFTVSVLHISTRTISINVGRGGCNWALTGIYASPSFRERLSDWDNLKAARMTCVGSWCVIGDWNEVSGPSQSTGCSFSQHRADVLNEALQHCDLTVIQSIGTPFTWRRSSTGANIYSQKCLDYAAADTEWLANFPFGTVETLNRGNSDHNPLILHCHRKPNIQGLPQPPFRWHEAWADHPDYLKVITDKWRLGNGDFLHNMNSIREASISFNRTCFGNIGARKRKIQRRLLGIQRIQTRVDSARLAILERQLLSEYNSILHQEELIWFQKSREKILLHGDRNTRFFQTAAKIHKNKSTIHGLQINNVWTTEDAILRGHAIDHFESRFSDSSITLAGCEYTEPLAPPDPDTEISVSQSVSNMEITQAIDSCPPYSAPGPDGFPTIFFKKYWHHIGPDTCDFIRTFFANGRLTPNLGFSYLCLIPKIATPLTIKDYRPISLCNVVYKFVTKVILYRLRPILIDYIGPEQSAFLPGRGTANNAIVLHEILYKFKQRQRGCEFAIKIDLDKAYDRVRWKFLRDSLTQMGLDTLSVSLIMECVTSAHFAILWNGRPSVDIYPSRGLRQGDPLSPYLFVIVMERLTRTINREVSARNWDPIVLSRGGPVLSHLLFADDVILMAQANVATVQTVNTVLKAFTEEAGLAINLNKSQIIFSAATPERKRNRICHQLSIPSTESFENYLGFPIIAGRRKLSHFEFIIEHISRRLPPWRAKFLNKAAGLL
ncbi:Unknown protein [Striga hermonthica]|uniref:Reverse transcriptase domain-containing protein n=1 Tax=Striga hermonthica TaxID=68872 RepID=A0A9N7MPA3_STRHE|nr:Unknown protein [Striga hermonthica]